MHFVKQTLREWRVLGRKLVGIEPRVRVRAHERLEFHGNSDGGWNVLADSLTSDSVVVDIGLGEEVSFSESIISKYGCVVFGFDPTPRAIRYVGALANERLRLFEFGLGTVAGRAEFFLPSNPRHVSGSVVLEHHLDPHSVEVQLITFGQIFEKIGARRIDLLKMDIEGAEYDVIQSEEFERYAGAVGQICVEFHHRWESRGKQSTELAVRRLNDLGFECAWYSPSTNEEFLFVRPGGLSPLIPTSSRERLRDVS